MLAVGQRLRRRDEFAAVVRAGRRVGRGVLVVHVTVPDGKTPDGKTPDGKTAEGKTRATEVREGMARRTTRAGFVVPRSVGGAVARNAVRRRLRHLVRDRLGRFPTGADVVVRALPGAAGRSYVQLGVDLDRALAVVVPRGRTSGTDRAAGPATVAGGPP